MRKLITNCPNCAGVLIEGKCPYCGTHVRYANELDIEGGIWSKPIELQVNIKQGDTTLILPLIGRITEVAINTEHGGYYADSRQIARVAVQRNVQFTFDGIIAEQREVINETNII